MTTLIQDELNPSASPLAPSAEPRAPRKEIELSEPVRMALLAAGVFVVYGNALGNGFTMDDHTYLARNPQVIHFSVRQLFAANAQTHVFRPLTFALLALNWKMGAGHAFVFHLVNLAAHAGVTVLLYLLLRTLLAQMPQARTVALAAAWLFAVHPIHTEALDSAMGLAEICAAGFLLAGWLLHLRDHEAAALACFALALLSKESAAVFPALVLLGDYLRVRWKPWARYARMGAVCVAYLAALWEAQGRRFGQGQISMLDNPLAVLPAHWRILNAVRVAWKYLALELYPRTLSADYSFNAIPIYLSWRHTLPAALAAAAVAAAWLWTVRKREMGWALAGGLYLIGFATTANLLMPIGTIMGERLAYLPSAGICLLAAVVVFQWGSGGREWRRWREYAAVPVMMVMVAALAARTVIRNQDWKDDLTLFSAAIKAVPGSAKAHSNFGIEYLDVGLLPIAHQEFQTALRIYPEYPDAIEYDGVIESRWKRYDQAGLLLEKAYEMSHRDNPNYGFMAVNWAALLMQTGRADQALAVLNREIAEEPDNARAWANRAVIGYQKGDAAAARADAETALRLDHENEQAQAVLRRLSNSAALATTGGTTAGRAAAPKPAR